MRKPLVNNQIRAYRIRVIDVTGEQLGIMDLQEALRTAKERNLDLIQVTEKMEPPVCKIGDYGKYLYSFQKRERKARKKTTQVKGVRISFSISPHDLNTRAKQAEKFLKKGDKVKVELILRGREKAHRDFAENKMKQFVEILQELIPVKIDQELKRAPKGLIMIISKG